MCQRKHFVWRKYFFGISNPHCPIPWEFDMIPIPMDKPAQNGAKATISLHKSYSSSKHVSKFRNICCGKLLQLLSSSCMRSSLQMTLALTIALAAPPTMRPTTSSPACYRKLLLYILKHCSSGACKSASNKLQST